MPGGRSFAVLAMRASQSSATITPRSHKSHTQRRFQCSSKRSPPVQCMSFDRVPASLARVPPPTSVTMLRAFGSASGQESVGAARDTPSPESVTMLRALRVRILLLACTVRSQEAELHQQTFRLLVWLWQCQAFSEEWFRALLPWNTSLQSQKAELHQQTLRSRRLCDCWCGCAGRVAAPPLRCTSSDTELAWCEGRELTWYADTDTPTR